jgi:hydrogenase-4 component B
MTLTVALACTAVLLATAALAVMIGRLSPATPIVYGLSLAASLLSLIAAVAALLGSSAPASLTLPLGLPWLGAHFRIDTLSAYFLAVVDLSGCCRSIRRFLPA